MADRGAQPRDQPVRRGACRGGGAAARRGARRRAVPGPHYPHRGAERADGPATGRGRPFRLPDALARGAARVSGLAVYARGNDRRRQHRRRHPGDDHRHRARDVERRPPARARAWPGAHDHRPGAQCGGVPREGSGAAPLRMILPLSLQQVSFRNIIHPLSLEIEAGPSTIILGANGAGKSVMMRLMHGLLAPSTGQVSWKRAGRHAMVFQRPVMLRRSALANVAYALNLAGEDEAMAVEALKEVGLSHVAHRPARVLSGGEQQRLALARAWALHPEVLFLDEPTASLDPTATREIEAVIRAFDGAGTKIVMATHNLGQARRLGDEIIYLHQGRVLERADVERFFKQPASPEAAAFIRGELPWV